MTLSAAWIREKDISADVEAKLIAFWPVFLVVRNISKIMNLHPELPFSLIECIGEKRSNIFKYNLEAKIKLINWMKPFLEHKIRARFVERFLKLFHSATRASVQLETLTTQQNQLLIAIMDIIRYNDPKHIPSMLRNDHLLLSIQKMFENLGKYNSTLIDQLLELIKYFGIENKSYLQEKGVFDALRAISTQFTEAQNRLSFAAVLNAFQISDHPESLDSILESYESESNSSRLLSIHSFITNRIEENRSIEKAEKCKLYNALLKSLLSPKTDFMHLKIIDCFQNANFTPEEFLEVEFVQVLSEALRTDKCPNLQFLIDLFSKYIVSMTKKNTETDWKWTDFKPIVMTNNDDSIYLNRLSSHRNQSSHDSDLLKTIWNQLDESKIFESTIAFAEQNKATPKLYLTQITTLMTLLSGNSENINNLDEKRDFVEKLINVLTYSTWDLSKNEIIQDYGRIQILMVSVFRTLYIEKITDAVSDKSDDRYSVAGYHCNSKFLKLYYSFIKDPNRNFPQHMIYSSEKPFESIEYCTISDFVFITIFIVLVGRDHDLTSEKKIQKTDLNNLDDDDDARYMRTIAYHHIRFFPVLADQAPILFKDIMNLFQSGKSLLFCTIVQAILLSAKVEQLCEEDIKAGGKSVVRLIQCALSGHWDLQNLELFDLLTTQLTDIASSYQQRIPSFLIPQDFIHLLSRDPKRQIIDPLAKLLTHFDLDQIEQGEHVYFKNNSYGENIIDELNKLDFRGSQQEFFSFGHILTSPSLLARVLFWKLDFISRRSPNAPEAYQIVLALYHFLPYLKIHFIQECDPSFAKAEFPSSEPNQSELQKKENAKDICAKEFHSFVEMIQFHSFFTSMEQIQDISRAVSLYFQPHLLLWKADTFGEKILAKLAALLLSFLYPEDKWKLTPVRIEYILLIYDIIDELPLQTTFKDVFSTLRPYLSFPNIQIRERTSKLFRKHMLQNQNPSWATSYTLLLHHHSCPSFSMPLTLSRILRSQTCLIEANLNSPNVDRLRGSAVLQNILVMVHRYSNMLKKFISGGTEEFKKNQTLANEKKEADTRIVIDEDFAKPAESLQDVEFSLKDPTDRYHLTKAHYTAYFCRVQKLVPKMDIPAHCENFYLDCYSWPSAIPSYPVIFEENAENSDISPFFRFREVLMDEKAMKSEQITHQLSVLEKYFANYQMPKTMLEQISHSPWYSTYKLDASGLYGRGDKDSEKQMKEAAKPTEPISQCRYYDLSIPFHQLLNVIHVCTEQVHILLSPLQSLVESLSLKPLCFDSDRFDYNYSNLRVCEIHLERYHTFLDILAGHCIEEGESEDKNSLKFVTVSMSEASPDSKCSMFATINPHIPLLLYWKYLGSLSIPYLNPPEISNFCGKILSSLIKFDIESQDFSLVSDFSTIKFILGALVSFGLNSAYNVVLNDDLESKIVASKDPSNFAFTGPVPLYIKIYLPHLISSIRKYLSIVPWDAEHPQNLNNLAKMIAPIPQLILSYANSCFNLVYLVLEIVDLLPLSAYATGSSYLGFHLENILAVVLKDKEHVAKLLLFDDPLFDKIDLSQLKKSDADSIFDLALCKSRLLNLMKGTLPRLEFGFPGLFLKTVSRLRDYSFLLDYVPEIQLILHQSLSALFAKGAASIAFSCIPQILEFMPAWDLSRNNTLLLPVGGPTQILTAILGHPAHSGAVQNWIFMILRLANGETLFKWLVALTAFAIDVKSHSVSESSALFKMIGDNWATQTFNDNIKIHMEAYFRNIVPLLDHLPPAPKNDDKKGWNSWFDAFELETPVKLNPYWRKLLVPLVSPWITAVEAGKLLIPASLKSNGTIWCIPGGTGLPPSIPVDPNEPTYGVVVGKKVVNVWFEDFCVSSKSNIVSSISNVDFQREATDSETFDIWIAPLLENATTISNEHHSYVRIGFATKKAINKLNEDSNFGCGDVEQSWAVDEVFCSLNSEGSSFHYLGPNGTFTTSLTGKAPIRATIDRKSNAISFKEVCSVLVRPKATQQPLDSKMVPNITIPLPQHRKYKLYLCLSFYSPRRFLVSKSKN